MRITALLRSLYSVQTWLRMREEFGIPGTESGPVVAWANGHPRQRHQSRSLPTHFRLHYALIHVIDQSPELVGWVRKVGQALRWRVADRTGA